LRAKKIVDRASRRRPEGKYELIRKLPISVVIVSRNQARFLPACFKSLGNQKFRDFEIVFIDDGSSDRTAMWVKRKKFARFRYFRNRSSLGPGRSRQRAVNESRGEFVAFLDSDDIWEPEKLRRQLAVFSNPGIALCYTRRFFIDGRGRRVSVSRSRRNFEEYRARQFESLPLPWKKWWPSPFPCTSSVMARKSSLLKVGSFDPNFRILCDDSDLWLRVVKKFGRRALRFISEPLTGYRLHAGQISMPALISIPHFSWRKATGKKRNVQEVILDLALFHRKWSGGRILRD